MPVLAGNRPLRIPPLIAGDVTTAKNARGLRRRLAVLGMVDQNVMPFGVLVAFDDFFFRNLGEGISIPDPLHVFDGVPEGS